MADPRNAEPALLVVAAFSRQPEALSWARHQLQVHYGAIGRIGPIIPFDQTTYYEATMGSGLLKQLLAFEQLVPQDQLAPIKLHTNALERELAAMGAFPEPRPLNLDPGVLTLGKFVLAATKDQAHRVYLQQGIYGEVTLRFQGGAFEPWPWTYADYRESAMRTVLNEFRRYLKERLQAARQA